MADTRIEKSNTDLEVGSNVLLRKKYFVDTQQVLMQKKPGVSRARGRVCRIISSSGATIAKKPVRLRLLRYGGDEGEKIRVNVIRDGEKIKSIIITCACGRSTELNCEYASDPGTAKQEA